MADFNDEAMALLKRIESGEVTLDLQKVIFFGPVEYLASDGWKLAVFDDAGEWDYLEWIESPEGQRRTFERLPEWFQDYQPPISVISNAYHWDDLADIREQHDEARSNQ
jgi:hypothetical protein